MIDIAVRLDECGCLEQLTLKGHAEGCPAGSNPACAAVTLLVRTAARLLYSRPGWTVDGDAPEPGNLSLVVHRRPKDKDEWLGGVTDILLQALADINEEFPDVISVNQEEKHNGT